jgi:hypothetical protein
MTLIAVLSDEFLSLYYLGVNMVGTKLTIFVKVGFNTGIEEPMVVTANRRLDPSTLPQHVQIPERSTYLSQWTIAHARAHWLCLQARSRRRAFLAVWQCNYQCSLFLVIFFAEIRGLTMKIKKMVKFCSLTDESTTFHRTNKHQLKEINDSAVNNISRVNLKDKKTIVDGKYSLK